MAFILSFLNFEIINTISFCDLLLNKLASLLNSATFCQLFPLPSKNVFIPIPTPFLDASAEQSLLDKFSASNTLQNIFSTSLYPKYGTALSEDNLDYDAIAFNIFIYLFLVFPLSFVINIIFHLFIKKYT